MLTLKRVLAFVATLFLLQAQADEPIDGSFELVNQEGESVTETSYSGKLRLVFFGFTQCPIICPTTMIEVSGVMKQLGDRGKEVQPLFISIDPENDRPNVVGQYAKSWHPSIIGLTGSADQVAAAARNFNVSYGKTVPTSPEQIAEVYHSTYLYLMDRNGRFLDVFGYGTSHRTIIATLEEYL